MLTSPVQPWSQRPAFQGDQSLRSFHRNSRLGITIRLSAHAVLFSEKLPEPLASTPYARYDATTFVQMFRDEHGFPCRRILQAQRCLMPNDQASQPNRRDLLKSVSLGAGWAASGLRWSPACRFFIWRASAATGSPVKVDSPFSPNPRRRSKRIASSPALASSAIRCAACRFTSKPAMSSTGRGRGQGPTSNW